VRQALLPNERSILVQLEQQLDERDSRLKGLRRACAQWDLAHPTTPRLLHQLHSQRVMAEVRNRVTDEMLLATWHSFEEQLLIGYKDPLELLSQYKIAQ